MRAASSAFSADLLGLAGADVGLLADRIVEEFCVAQAVAEGGDTASAKVREASEAIARLVRS